MRGTLEERFWAKVQLPTEPDGCLIWSASKCHLGYGRMSVAGRSAKAHRVSYELLVGPIPEGLVIDHLCRNRACVNPNHLEAVTQKVSVHRGGGVAAIKARKTRCHVGHPLAGDNLRIDSYGRHCRACAIKRDADRYALKRKG